jgi:hypothetical protein
VVAILVSLSVGVGVGAFGSPVNVGEAKSAFKPSASNTEFLLGACVVSASAILSITLPST